MKITETGASNAPPPKRGGATEQRAGSSFDQLLALHDPARTAAAEGPKTKSERHDRGVRAHGDSQRAHDARRGAPGEAETGRAPVTDETPAEAAPVAERAASEPETAAIAPTVAPVAAESAAAPVVPVLAPAAPRAEVVATTTAAEADAPPPTVPALPAAVAEDAGLPLPAAPAEGSEQAPATSPAVAPATDAPKAAAASDVPAQPAVQRSPIAAGTQASSEQAATPAEGEQAETPTTAAPVRTAHDTAAPPANDRARAVAAPPAAVHDTAPVAAVEGAPAAASSPAAALRGPQHAGGLQLAATVERLRDLVQVAARNGVAHARLQLHPAEFGGIDVRLRASAQGLTAKITADRPEAVQALQQAAAELRQSLQDRGLTVLDVEVSLASAGGSSAHDAAAQAGGSDNGLDSQTTSDRRGMDAAPDTTDLDEPELGAAPRGDAGAVLVDVLA